MHVNVANNNVPCIYTIGGLPLIILTFKPMGKNIEKKSQNVLLCMKQLLLSLLALSLQKKAKILLTQVFI